MKLLVILLVLGSSVASVLNQNDEIPKIFLQHQKHLAELANSLVKSNYTLNLTKTKSVSYEDIKQLENDSYWIPTPEELACYRDLMDVINGTDNLEPWALQMIDSGTKLQSGILEGNIFDLGNYDECVQVQRPSYLGQHCMVAIIVVHINGTQVTYPFELILSSCFPSTCSYSVVGKVFNAILAPINKNLPAGIILYAETSTSSCRTIEKPSLDTTDWIVILVCAMIVVLAVLSTAIDILILKEKQRLTKPEEILRAFSLFTNGTKLLSTKSRGGEMGVLNGLKFISMAWVILGHKYLITSSALLVNKIKLTDSVKEWSKMVIFNATVSVDTFFVISGFLNALGFFTIVNKKKSYKIFDLIMSYIHRYIRLTPPYALMIALYATVLIHFGSGPVWNETWGREKNNCVSFWWTNILYVNNYLDVEQCLGQSWYLGTDMQLFWLSPLLLYPLWRWPIFGMIELVIVILGSIAAPFAISYHFNYKSPIPMTASDQDETEILYTPTHARTLSYVIGIALGLLVYKIRTGKLNIRLHKAVTLSGWLASGALMLYSIFGAYWFFQYDYPYTQISASFFLSFFRLTWSLGVGWVIFACVTNRGGFINTLLSWKVMWPLSRLTYCAYLVHIAVILMRIAQTRVPEHFDDYSMIQQYLGELVMAMCWAAVLSMFVEAPTMALEKILLGGLLSPRSKQEATA